MQQQIEDSIFEIYKHVLLKSNFQLGHYTQTELTALCNEVSGLYEYLTVLALQNGLSASMRTNKCVKKITGFACN